MSKKTFPIEVLLSISLEDGLRLLAETLQKKFPGTKIVDGSFNEKTTHEFVFIVEELDNDK